MASFAEKGIPDVFRNDQVDDVVTEALLQIYLIQNLFMHMWVPGSNHFVSLPLQTVQLLHCQKEAVTSRMHMDAQ